MDFFGIGSAVKGAARIYFQSARRTGRTTALINSLKDGDRVIFSDGKEANRVKGLCLDRGLNVSCIVISPTTPERLMERPLSEGRTIFDHSWVEQLYLGAIEGCDKHLDYIQDKASRAPQERSEFADDVSRRWL